MEDAVYRLTEKANTEHREEKATPGGVPRMAVWYNTVRAVICTRS